MIIFRQCFTLSIHLICNPLNLKHKVHDCCRTRLIYVREIGGPLEQVEAEWKEACGLRTMWTRLEAKAQDVDLGLVDSKIAFTQITQSQVRAPSTEPQS